MTFEAQIILSNTATCNGPTNDICNQSSYKVQQIYLNIFSYSTYNLNQSEKYLLANYLSLLRRATSNDALSNEKQRILSDLLCESEEFVNEPENAMTDSDKVHHDELKLLHEICDGDIALHSVELAIQVCRDLIYQSRAQVLRLPVRLQQIRASGGPHSFQVQT